MTTINWVAVVGTLTGEGFPEPDEAGFSTAPAAVTRVHSASASRCCGVSCNRFRSWVFRRPIVAVGDRLDQLLQPATSQHGKTPQEVDRPVGLRSEPQTPPSTRPSIPSLLEARDARARARRCLR